VLDGAIYANELRDAQEQGGITSVPYDPTMSVSVYFDLGWSDQTAVWFVQHIASEIRLIDFYQDTQRPFSHYLHMLQSRGYTYATVWLPHDAQAKSLA
jgi:phage terminase large subunit